MPRPTTESRLREWRSGQVGAERLAAAILNLDGFIEIDPQAPLGGPDGGKDILCKKNFKQFVCGVYFPTTEVIFSKLKRKFIEDLEGAKRHNARGFIFITNQTISLNDRKTLEKIAIKSDKISVVYHQERIRALLDSPTGYGVRIEYLEIPMNKSEQLAYFAFSSNRLEYALKNQINEIRMLAQRIGKLQTSQSYAAETMYVLATQLGKTVSPPPRFPQNPKISLSNFRASSEPISAAITPSILAFIHRIVCTEIPFGYSGRFRDRKVWLGKPGTTEESADIVPPEPEKIAERLKILLEKWNCNYPDLQSETTDHKLREIAQFHQQFLEIHPFLDGNGRVARTLLAQQCVDLFGHIDPVLFDRGADYYTALRRADTGDFKLLGNLISRAVNH